MADRPGPGRFCAQASHLNVLSVPHIAERAVDLMSTFIVADRRLRHVLHGQRYGFRTCLD